jgi:SagB-type dehydrogenase family enzyme
MNFVKQFFKQTDIKQEYNEHINIVDKYPQDWLDIHFKFYPRFKSIKLKKFKPKNLLEKTILNRRSYREYKSSYKIDLDTLSRLLFFTNKIKNRDGSSLNSRRPYPSAGARFPIEQYIIIFNGSDITPGLYHYNVYNHSLESIRTEDSREFFKSICNSDWITNSSALVVLSCIPLRTCIKYNNRGIRYILFEIGHIAQNIMLIAESLGLHTCAIGGFDDKKLAKYLKCEKTDEYPLYLITLGK